MTAPDTAVVTWDHLQQYDPVPGITGSVVSGTELSAAVFKLDAGAVVPRHQHVNEEFGQILSGSLELEVDGVVSMIHAGDGFLIPGWIWHAAVAGPEGCLLLECYAPPRNPFIPPAEED